MSASPTTRRLAAILAADIAGYSALVGTDEEGTVRALKGHQAAVLPMVGQHGGRVIDTAGDGIMAEFSSVLAALKCALAIQATMAERNADVLAGKRLRYRIGLNLGDVIFDETRIYGDGINVAARLEGLAEPGGICVSATVYEHSGGKIDCAFDDLGEQALKNIARPVRVYRVRAQAAARAETGGSKLALPDKPSIAVLPFTNMSGDPEQEYFADGIAEDVLTELSRLRWLFVTARNSSFTYKGKAIDVKQVSRELGVRFVLEGSVRKAGNRVRVTGQLIDATTGNHIWAEKYDRNISDIFSVQDEITQAVVNAIGPAIVDTERQRAVRKPPENLDAWEAYQRGMWHMAKNETTEFGLAQAFLKQAIALDPSFSPPYCALALTHIMGAIAFNLSTLEEASAEAEPLVRRAMALDEQDADARARLAQVMFIRGDLKATLEWAERALEINPNCGDGHGEKGAALIYLNKGREGREELKRGLAQNPLDPWNAARLCGIGFSHFIDEEYEEATSIFNRATQLYPNHPMAYGLLAASLAHLGKDNEAKEVLAVLNSLSPAWLPIYTSRPRPFMKKEYHARMLDGLRKIGYSGPGPEVLLQPR